MHVTFNPVDEALFSSVCEQLTTIARPRIRRVMVLRILRHHSHRLTDQQLNQLRLIEKGTYSCPPSSASTPVDQKVSRPHPMLIQP